MAFSKLLSRLTSSADEQSNIKRMLTRGTCYTASITLVSVPVLQVFAMTNGIGEATLGVVRLFVQAGGILGYLLFMRYANKIPTHALVRQNSLAHLGIAVLPLALLPLSLFSSLLPPTVFLVLYTAGWTVSGFLLARLSVMLARVESHLFVSPIYGKAFGVAGIVYYLVSMVLSAGVKGALSWGNAGFPPIFAGAALLALAAAFASRGFRLVKTAPAEMPAEPAPETIAAPAIKPGTTLAKPGKTISIIILMHICRGIMAAIAFFFVPVALKSFRLLPSDAGTVSLLFSAGYLVGYLLIFRAFDRIGAAHTTLIGAILQIVPFLLLAFLPGRITFFAFYFIFCLGDILIAQGVPLGILQTIPSASIGTVTALRLVAMQIADALTAFGIGGVVVKHFAWFAGIYCLLALLVALSAWFSLARPQTN